LENDMQNQSARQGPIVVGLPPSAAAASEIEAAIAGQWQAWNDGQPLRDSDFTPDSDYVTFDGTELHGLEANRRLHDELGKGVLRGSQLSGEVRRIRFIAADIAVVHSVGNLRLRFHRRPKPGRESVQTTVMRRTPDGWKIEAFHNTRIRKAGWLGRLAVRLANRL
jgi:uncharacterized protein (TIGR02246 family)